MNRALPIAAVTLVLVVAWYAGAIVLNGPQVVAVLDNRGVPWGTMDYIHECWNMGRAVLPTPHQIVADLWHTIFDYPIGNARNILYPCALHPGSRLCYFRFRSGARRRK